MLEGAVVFKGIHNGNDILIRHVRRDDTKPLMDFINVLSIEQTYITFQGEQMTLIEESNYIDGFIKKAENHGAVKLLVFHGEELIGLADVFMKDRAESHIGVFGIMLAKEWRAKGIGKFLMQLTLDEAKKNIPTMKIITLGVFCNNPIAKALYEKMGFATYGMLPKGLQHKGELVDHLYMYKEV